MDGKRFMPTDIGRIVNGFLTEHFTQYVDYDFTARLEDDLDAISLGDEDLVPLLERFWKPFNDLVIEKEQSVTREQVAQARELGTDPKSVLSRASWPFIRKARTMRRMTMGIVCCRRSR